MINLYIMPLVFSLLANWSIRNVIRNFNFPTKILITFLICCVVIFLYTFAHGVARGERLIDIIDNFALNNLVAAFIICTISVLYGALFHFNGKKKR